MPLTLYNKFNKSIVLCIQLRSLYCTKGNLDNATAKKHLNNFLDNRKEPGMMHSYSSFQQALNSYNLRRNSTHWRDMPRFCLMPKHQYLLAGMVAVFRKEKITCGRSLSEPLRREKALSQNKRISLFSEWLVRSVVYIMSADLSQRFFEKQKITTCNISIENWTRTVLPGIQSNIASKLKTQVDSTKE